MKQIESLLRFDLIVETFRMKDDGKSTKFNHTMNIRAVPIPHQDQFLHLCKAQVATLATDDL